MFPSGGPGLPAEGACVLSLLLLSFVCHFSLPCLLILSCDACVVHMQTLLYMAVVSCHVNLSNLSIGPDTQRRPDAVVSELDVFKLAEDSHPVRHVPLPDLMLANGEAP